MTTSAVSKLVDAITRNDTKAVAAALDKPKATVEPEALVALVHLAWKTRGSDMDPDQVDAAESARQIFDLLSSSGADFYHETSRGRIIDRIAKVQPDWPQASDLAKEPNRCELQSGRDLAGDTDEPSSSRATRGATHRARRA